VPDLCAVVLAAGVGLRLRPLTGRCPKALCPVGNVPLLDRTLSRVGALGLTGPERVAVNASYLAEQVVAHVGTRAHLSVEPGQPLGTAGALGKLRDWIGGRGVLVANSDAYLSPDAVDGLLQGWAGETVRLLGVPTTPDDPNRFGGYRFAGSSLLPWHRVKDLRAEPAELVRIVWRAAEAAGELEIQPYPGTYLDTGTPRDYLAANLDVAAVAAAEQETSADGSLIDPGATVTGRCERAVVGAGAVVRGDLTRSVVWPGGRVAAGEHLVDAIRAGDDLTVKMAGC
jgi:N-acetyl-alpha-D-muramate 1-phosphate uridylyltransferase